MLPNPALGIVFHWLGGLASGSFYVPFRWVRAWSWETYWLVGGVFSWILAPSIVALLLTNDLPSVLRESPRDSLWLVYIFGVLWGLGGLTFGLTMRYLGMSLGMAVALGYCAAFGTLMPPIFRHEFVGKVLHTQSGLVILAGIAVCLLGIALAGAAGVSKERELSDQQKRAAIREFNLRRGLLVATFAGIMSACFSYGLAAGDPIRAAALRHGAAPLWQGLPVLVVVLLGGFTTNVIWCVILSVRNRTGHEYLARYAEPSAPHHDRQAALENPIDAPSEEMATRLAVRNARPARVPLASNYLLCAIAGITWYFQFFFYTMGETQMGAYKFSSWTLHMASIIIFSTLWGIALHEWKGAGTRTRALVALSLAVLIASTLIVGYGNYLGTADTTRASASR